MSDELELKRKKLRLLQLQLELKNRNATTEPSQMTYDDASKMDVVGEMGRSVARGGQYAAEFLGDVADVGVSAMPGTEETLYDTLNPFGPPDRGDKSRQPIWDTGVAKHMTAENIERGGSTPLDFTKTALEYVIPTMTGGAGKKMIAETVGTALGAATGEQIGEEFGDTWVGEMVGAIGGGFSSTKLAQLFTKVANYLPHKSGDKLSPDEIKQVVQVLLDNSENPELAIKNFETALERGDVGTVADFMADPDVYNIEATAKQNTPAQRAQLATEQARSEQIIERVDPEFGAGDTGAPVALADERLTQAIEGVQSTTRNQRQRGDVVQQQGLDASVGRVNQADAVTDQAVVAVNQAEEALSDVPPSVQSETLSTLYDTTEKAVRENDVQPLWDVFDAEPDIATPDMEAFLDGTLKKLERIDEIEVRAEFKKAIQTINEMGDMTSPKQIHAVIRSIKTRMAGIESAKPYQRQMAIINAGLEDFLKNSPAGATYEAAIDAERQINARFKPPGIGNARRKSEGETFGSKLFKQFEEGAVTAREVLQSDSPAIIEATKATIRAYAKRDGVDEKFMRKYGELIDGFDMGDELGGIATMRETADSLSAASTQIAKDESRVQTGLNKTRDVLETSTGKKRSANVKAANESTLGRLKDNPKGVMRDLFSKQNLQPERDLRSLISAVGRSTPERNNLKRHIGDYFISQIKKTDKVIDPAIVEEFERLKPMLESNGFMDGSEISAIAEILGMTGGTKLRKAATSQIKEKLSTWQNLGASGIAAVALTGFPGSSLILAGAVRRFVKDNMLHAKDPAVQKALKDMATNPELFADAIKNYKPPTKASNVPAFMWKVVKDVINSSRSAATPAIILAPRGEEEEK